MLAAETLVSAVFILYFCRSFTISKWLILIHLPLSFGLFAASMLIPALLLYVWQVREFKLIRPVLALVPGLTFAAIGILYATDFASYFWLGNNINYKLLHLFVNDWRHGGELVSLSRSIYFAVIAFVILVLAAYIGFAGKIFSGLENLLLPARPVSLFKNRRRAIKSSVVIALLLVAYSVDLYVLSQRAAYSELLSSDPFLSFVRRTTEVYDPNYPAFASKLRQEEQQCRSSYPRTQKFDRKNVVIIIVDALRADHTQVYGYDRATTPFLQNLIDAGRLQKVEFATSACSGTFCGVMSTLASKPLKQLIAGDFKLYDLLHDMGYQTYLILSGSHKIQGLRESYGDEMTLYFDGENSKKYTSTDDRLIFEGLDRVPNYRDTPAFFYIHLMAVHLTGVKQPAFNFYQPEAERQDFRAMFRGESGHWPMIINTYDNSVMQADATIKEIFDTLNQKGYLRDSIVAILADHGEGLGERSKYGWGHGHWLYKEFIQIPLLIYEDPPGKYANLKFATQIDVAPTIVDRLGLRIPDCWQGTSLLRSEIRTVTTHQTEHSRPCYAVLYRTGAAMYEYISCSVGKTEELYNLTSDPTEQMNLIGSADASLVAHMRQELRRSQAD
jgi:glucan phosphoethanolaminetransferase (alkaline phosphatase superfamily)